MKEICELKLIIKQSDQRIELQGLKTWSSALELTA